LEEPPAQACHLVGLTGEVESNQVMIVVIVRLIATGKIKISGGRQINPLDGKRIPDFSAESPLIWCIVHTMHLDPR
jgi:hypothetical protein